MNIIFQILLLNFIFNFNSHASIKIKNTELVVKIESIPWGLEIINDDLLLISQKNGVLSLYNRKTKKLTNKKLPFDISTDAQGGLLDVEKHPDFIKNHKIYFVFSELEKNKESHLSLGVMEYENEGLKNIQIIKKFTQPTSVPAHFGSRITFDKKNYLYVSTGDRFRSRDKAQDINSHFGKVFRLNDDGTTPSDNPFNNEVWSYGHRNPQGLKFHLEKNILIEIEHGPRGGDEINLIEKGKNYGWPEVSLGKEYDEEKDVGVKHKDGMEDAIKVYVPSIAPCGFDYIGNKLFISALAGMHLNVVTLDQNNKITDEERLLVDKEWRIRDVKTINGNSLFISTDTGEIYKLDLEL